ncbi:MAG: polysaccharide biosynthesis transport protein [Chthoniobacter sp.]|jgi:capsular exopolysaccharide synthesis family protein|nr:polysaccharide biosynthesis transport protein [Chthoniobacter sp.]
MRDKPQKQPDRALSLEAINWKNIFYAVRAKLWLVVLCVIAAGGAGALYIRKAPVIYSARTVIQVEQKEQRVVNVQNLNEEDLRFPDLLNTLVQSISSRTVLLRVVEANHLEENYDFLPKPASGSYSKDQALGALISCLSVNLRRGTRLIDITVEHTNPDIATLLAQSVVQEYVRHTYEQRSVTARGASEFLAEEAERLKTHLEKAEQRLHGYRQDNNAVSLEDRQNIVVEQLKDLNGRLGQAKAERMRLETDFAQVQARTGNPAELLQVPSLASQPAVAIANSAIQEKEAELAALRQRYGPKHPRLISALTDLRNFNAARAALLRNSAELVGASFQLALKNEQEFEKALAQQEQKALDLNKMSIQYNVLVRDVETDRVLYQSLVTRMKETDVTKGLEQSPIRVFEPAFSSGSPVRPAKQRIMQTSLLAGLLLGLTLVGASNALDSTFKTVEQTESTLALPVLASIPETQSRSATTRTIEIPEEPQVIEAFRSLRTALALTAFEKERRTLVFTSAGPGEGKSFSATNFAMALAQQGLSTLLIDADLRKPVVSRLFFGEERKPGLIDCLQHRSNVREAVHATELHHLKIMPTGTMSADRAELLAGSGFADLLAEAILQFDRVVIDTAPLNPVSDTLLLAPHVDAVCLVVRAGSTGRGAAVRACRALKAIGCKPVGVVLNRLRRQHLTGGYYEYIYGDHKGGKVAA